MTRTVPEWIGASPDQRPPQRVRDRVWLREGGRCGQCARKIRAGESWTLEHVVALINGGENREQNLGVTCRNCLRAKNAADVAEKSKTYRMRTKHTGAKKRGQGGLTHPYLKRKVSGEVVPR